MKDFLLWVGSVTPVESVELPSTLWKSGNLQATTFRQAQVIFGEKSRMALLQTRNLEKSQGEIEGAVREFCLGDSAGQFSLFNKK